jgi:hypothetical protein
VALSERPLALMMAAAEFGLDVLPHLKIMLGGQWLTHLISLHLASSGHYAVPGINSIEDLRILFKLSVLLVNHHKSEA